ncbi:hypothetical protein SUGI_0788370 [Cryptomeria japonica]|nr:hypothetical protein SUGI_0788360 [Cryptomeria japonica]GLJ38678.1 hypothetical protein SUGI_0788370 [Cryptomeria japonica]
MKIQISTIISTARLAQLVERKALNLVVVGSSPTVGAFFAYILWNTGVCFSRWSRARKLFVVVDASYTFRCGITFKNPISFYTCLQRVVIISKNLKNVTHRGCLHSIVAVRSLRKRKVASSILAGGLSCKILRSLVTLMSIFHSYQDYLVVSR